MDTDDEVSGTAAGVDVGGRQKLALADLRNVLVRTSVDLAEVIAGAAERRPMSNWSTLAASLTESLGLAHPPVGVAWSTGPSLPSPRYDAPLAPPAADGRTGRVPASCVFWTKAGRGSFSTVAEDHGNCSVGAVTHGFRSWDEVAGHDDVASLFATGWVAPDDLPSIPVVAKGTTGMTYGSLAAMPVDPDVVLIRLTAEQAMILHDAIPEVRVTGKPQCQILALAKEGGEIALSLGCALSRVRMSLPDGELTCAIPAGRLAEAVDRLGRRDDTNDQVRTYAADDARRFDAAS